MRAKLLIWVDGQSVFNPHHAHKNKQGAFARTDRILLI
jgi:hypothetical protein